jgi:hypothetical protein
MNSMSPARSWPETADHAIDREGADGSLGSSCLPDDEKRFLFETWKGFIAVGDEPNLWSVCFDRYEDGSKRRVDEGQRTVEIEVLGEEMEG